MTFHELPNDTSISKIEDGLYISDIHHVMREDAIYEKYDIIITVCRNEPVQSDDPDVSWQQFGLWDDDVEQQDTFDSAVQATIKAIETHEDADVLVHCIAGQSRSPAVVATALAHRDDIHFDDATELLEEQRPQVRINSALREHGLQFLGQDDQPFKQP